MEVSGSDHDFRVARPIGAQDIDCAYRGLARDRDGLAGVRLRAPDGTGIDFWVDGNYPYIQVYTAHTQPEPHRRTGLAVEPMTCVANAYRTSEGLIRLLPGQSHTATWGLRPTGTGHHTTPTRQRR